MPIHKTVFTNSTNDNTKAVMADHNKEFTANRLIVEDVFGWLKQRACILDSKCPRQLYRQTQIFNAACGLHNFVRMLRMEHAMKQRASQPNHSQ